MLLPSFIRRFLEINLREAEFDRRGFTCSNAEVRGHLETIGRTFLHGYSAAMAQGDQNSLASALDQIQPEQRGFAYEGAAMALALQDAIMFRGNQFLRFAKGPGSRHIYMLHVGAGWAYARLPWTRRRIERVFARLDPILRWLAIEGYGFHQGYFDGKAQAISGLSASGLSEHGRHVFYQGLGRSLWFIDGADVHRIRRSIFQFSPLYHNDAWSGVGLACAYAGGIPSAAIRELRQESGLHAAALAQGAAFAAKARQLAGNPAPHTDTACSVICQMPAGQAAALCDAAFARISPLHSCPYQDWRLLLQKSFMSWLEIPNREHGFVGIA
jgi:ADP-ribose pyrophosphatase YjhB (NUDIX family)